MELIDLIRFGTRKADWPDGILELFGYKNIPWTFLYTVGLWLLIAVNFNVPDTVDWFNSKLIENAA